MAKQLKIYAGNTMMHIIESAPNRPWFNSNDEAGLKNGVYTSSNQVNRYLHRGMESLLLNVPDLSNQTWSALEEILEINGVANVGVELLENSVPAYFNKPYLDELIDSIESGSIDFLDYKNDDAMQILAEIQTITPAQWLSVREVLERKHFLGSDFPLAGDFDFMLSQIRRSFLLNLASEESFRSLSWNEEAQHILVAQEGGIYSSYISFKPEESDIKFIKSEYSMLREHKIAPFSFNIMGIKGNFRISDHTDDKDPKFYGLSVFPNAKMIEKIGRTDGYEVDFYIENLVENEKSKELLMSVMELITEYFIALKESEVL